MNLPISTVYHRVAKDQRYDPKLNQLRSHKYQYKEISQYTLDGVYIRDYYSIAAAAKDQDISSGQISVGIRNGTKVHGFYYTYKGE